MKLNKLYKRSTAGKISEWQIEIEGDKFRTESGFSDGKQFTSDWTICKGKSYNTAEEQALKQAKAIHKKKIEQGAFENIKDIDKPTIFKVMLAHDYNDYKDKIKFPIGSQRKLDGIRDSIDKNGMFSRNGKEIISAPHILESLKEDLFIKYPDIHFDGELFAERSTCDFNKIISCVRKIKPTKEDLEESKKYIQFWIYDCPSHPGNFKERYEYLKTLELPKYCVLLTTEIANNEKELMDLYTQYMEEGFEGQILRVLDSKYENKRSKNLLKHKVFFDKEFEIKGYTEGIGKLSGKIGTLIFEIDGKQFNSSVNGDHEYLETLFKSNNLIGKMATVKYFELTTDGIPRFPKVIGIRDFE